VRPSLFLSSFRGTEHVLSDIIPRNIEIYVTGTHAAKVSVYRITAAIAVAAAAADVKTDERVAPATAILVLPRQYRRNVADRVR